MGVKGKDKRDIFYRFAKEQGWRARSAYKLMQIDDEFQILKDVKRAVDLCAAPGSWSQVLANRLVNNQPTDSASDGEKAIIVAVDLQPMSPIEGVIQLRGDITEEKTAYDIIAYFDGGKADLVVCDGAPDVTGLHSLDEYMQSQLVLSAFNISTFVLKPGGSFIAKIFRAKNASLLYTQMKLFFSEVYAAKPKASRQSSCESFIVCKNYQPPEGYVPTMSQKMPSKIRDYEEYESTLLSTNLSSIAQFVACGDLSGWDSDRSYSLELEAERQSLELSGLPIPNFTFPESYVYRELDPVQPPTEPAYKTALSLKKNMKLVKPVNSELVELRKKNSAYRKMLKKDRKRNDLLGAGYEDDNVEGIGNMFLEDS